MQLFLPFIAFIFYRVIFKIMYGVNLPVLPNLIICVGLLATTFPITYFLGLRRGRDLAMVRFGKTEPSLKIFPPRLVLLISLTAYALFCALICFGFADRFYGKTWDNYRHDFVDTLLIAFVFCIPLIAHYVSLSWAIKNELKRVKEQNDPTP